MSIHETIKSETTAAMKAQDAERLSALRNILAAFTNEAVAQGEKPDTLLSDDQAQTVLKRLAKQRRESISQYRAGGREEAAAKEERELAIIEEYLPAAMGEDELRAIIEETIKELGISDKSQMGQLIGAVMKAAGGTALGADVKRIAEELLG